MRKAVAAAQLRAAVTVVTLGGGARVAERHGGGQAEEAVEVTAVVVVHGPVDGAVTVVATVAVEERFCRSSQKMTTANRSGLLAAGWMRFRG